MYLSNTTRPDITYATNYLARFIQQPLKDHWIGAKHVLRYLGGTDKFGIYYNKNGNGALKVYADSDLAQERPDRKSVTGFVFSLAGGAISWKSNKQSIAAQSSPEAEYIAVSFAIREALWLSKFWQPLQLDQRSMAIYVDNQGCLQISKDNVLNETTKHIDVKYQMIMDNAKSGHTRLKYVPSENNISDR